VRPRYETKEDLTREAEISRVAAQKFNCTFSKMPDRYGLDFCAVRDGAVVAFAEVKVRTTPHLMYQTYMISLGKAVAARSLHEATGLPSILIVGWSDAWGQTRLDTAMKPGSIRVGGRADRGDPQDIEPVVMIPLSDFLIYPA
jgi:hypothetical protein